MSFKKFVGLPSNVSNTILSRLFENTINLTIDIESRNMSKINNRFHTEYAITRRDIRNDRLSDLRFLPSNFIRLFNFAKY